MSDAPTTTSKSWWKILLSAGALDILPAIAGGLLGAHWADGEKINLTSFTSKLKDIVEGYKQDRESVMKALERAHCWKVLDLITRANAAGYIEITFDSHRKRYREYWIIARLATVDPDARQWYYLKLDSYLDGGDSGVRDFFGRLEGLNNNELPQWFRQLGAVINDVGEELLEKLAEAYRKLDNAAKRVAQPASRFADWLESLPGGSPGGALGRLRDEIKRNKAQRASAANQNPKGGSYV